jgi:hypothetical protein
MRSRYAKRRAIGYGLRLKYRIIFV